MPCCFSAVSEVLKQSLFLQDTPENEYVYVIQIS